jgi:hypothetical protein
MAGYYILNGSLVRGPSGGCGQINISIRSAGFDRHWL